MQFFAWLRTLRTVALGVLFLLIQGLFALSPRAAAQALPTASKTMDITPFVGFTTVDPDYGPYRDHGVTGGVDFTRYFGWKIDPSLELRASSVTGKVLSQKSFQVGVRAQTTLFDRFDPYVDFLGGIGSIHFFYPPFPGYVGDRSPVYSFGGGVDIDLNKRFQVKVDYQGDFRKFDQNFSLTPRPFTVGVAYKFPFRPHYDRASH